VFQGMLLASRDRLKVSSMGATAAHYGGSVTTPAGYLLALWRHECERVFCDKLVSAEDKAWAAGAILELAQCGLATQRPPFAASLVMLQFSEASAVA